MKNDINLINSTPNLKKEKTDMFLVSAVSFFAICFVVTVLVLFYSFLLKSRISTLNSSVNDLKTRTSLVSSQKDKLLTISERLGTIRKIISSRRSLNDKMQGIVSLIPGQFRVDKFSATDAEISVSLISSSLSDFNDFLENSIPKITTDKKLGVKRAEIGNFTQNATNYSLLVTFYFNK